MKSLTHLLLTLLIGALSCGIAPATESLDRISLKPGTLSYNPF